MDDLPTRTLPGQQRLLSALKLASGSSCGEPGADACRTSLHPRPPLRRLPPPSLEGREKERQFGDYQSEAFPFQRAAPADCFQVAAPGPLPPGWGRGWGWRVTPPTPSPSLSPAAQSLCLNEISAGRAWLTLHPYPWLPPDFPKSGLGSEALAVCLAQFRAMFPPAETPSILTPAHVFCACFQAWRQLPLLWLSPQELYLCLDEHGWVGGVVQE